MNSEQDRCEITVIHEERVTKVREEMPSEENISVLSDFFRMFGDSTRLRILFALEKSELCVCDIAFLLGMTQSAISHQLRVLRTSELVKSRKDGKVTYYSLKDTHVKEILETGLTHIHE